MSHHKGSHQSQKVVNALILLNCDEGAFNGRRARGEDIAEILRISARKVDRVKRRFVEEGMEAALGGRQGRRPTCARKADGDFEARLVALGCGDPPEGTRSGRCVFWRTGWSNSATSTACRTRRCVAF